ncbi:hypothetical protein QJS10_CPB19g00902 [Acorus calamus]|uniref:Uncharacterized protein n=1 Tax=Acorus calamus TaxID=4465 RepID=A0AAV9CFX4_ACOCL|nr:hypothetical protein QJS10_CPB19g00902 [Acorus calamus]
MFDKKPTSGIDLRSISMQPTSIGKIGSLQDPAVERDIRHLPDKIPGTGDAAELEREVLIEKLDIGHCLQEISKSLFFSLEFCCKNIIVNNDYEGIKFLDWIELQ